MLEGSLGRERVKVFQQEWKGNGNIIVLINQIYYYDDDWQWLHESISEHTSA